MRRLRQRGFIHCVSEQCMINLLIEQGPRLDIPVDQDSGPARPGHSAFLILSACLWSFTEAAPITSLPFTRSSTAFARFRSPIDKCPVLRKNSLSPSFFSFLHHIPGAISREQQGFERLRYK